MATVGVKGLINIFTGQRQTTESIPSLHRSQRGSCEVSRTSWLARSPPDLPVTYSTLYRA